MRVGTTELLVVLLVVLVVFGPKNLPKLGKMFGKTVNNFKKGMDEADDDEADDEDEKPAKKAKKAEKAEKAEDAEEDSSEE